MHRGVLPDHRNRMRAGRIFGQRQYGVYDVLPVRPRRRHRRVGSGQDGAGFFFHSFGHHYLFGEHEPGKTSIYDNFKAIGTAAPTATDGFGTPDEIRRYLKHLGEHRRRSDPAAGAKRQRSARGHLLIAELFFKEVMPEYKERNQKRQKEKAVAAGARDRARAQTQESRSNRPPKRPSSRPTASSASSTPTAPLKNKLFCPLYHTQLWERGPEPYRSEGSEPNPRRRHFASLRRRLRTTMITWVSCLNNSWSTSIWSEGCGLFTTHR